MLTFISDQASTDTSLPIIGIDPLTDGLSAGAVPFLFDLFKDYQASHAAAAYANGDVIADLSETADGSFMVGAGSVSNNATYGGADLSASTGPGNYLAGPSGALSAIHAGSQYFAVAFYVLMPSSSDWNSSGSLAPLFATTNATGGFGYNTPEPDMLTIAQQSGGIITARRQTNGGTTVVTTLLTLDAAAYGKVALIMFWRNASGIGLRVKTSASDQTVTGTVGAVNSGDFSAKVPQFGVVRSFWGSTAAHLNAMNFTVLRGWIENLQLSGRDPATVFNADWARVADRIAAL